MKSLRHSSTKGKCSQAKNNISSTMKVSTPYRKAMSNTTPLDQGNAKSSVFSICQSDCQVYGAKEITNIFQISCSQTNYKNVTEESSACRAKKRQIVHFCAGKNSKNKALNKIYKETLNQQLKEKVDIKTDSKVKLHTKNRQYTLNDFCTKRSPEKMVVRESVFLESPCNFQLSIRLNGIQVRPVATSFKRDNNFPQMIEFSPNLTQTNRKYECFTKPSSVNSLHTEEKTRCLTMKNQSNDKISGKIEEDIYRSRCGSQVDSFSINNPTPRNTLSNLNNLREIYTPQKMRSTASESSQKDQSRSLRDFKNVQRRDSSLTLIDMLQGLVQPQELMQDEQEQQAYRLNRDLSHNLFKKQRSMKIQSSM